MLLSLLTLGIWSAWATVRNRRYIYGNTELAGNRFDFHGNPWAILRGRVLAVAFFLAYVIGGDFSVFVPAVTIVLLVILFPWMLASAMRFRLSNTSWRNLRFDFAASFRNSYAQLGLPLLLVLLTLTWFIVLKIQVEGSQTYIESLKWNGMAILLLLLASFFLVPLAIHRIRALTFNALRYGRHMFSANLRLTRFLGLYALTSLVFIASMVVMIAIIFFLGKMTGGLDAALIETVQGKRVGTMIIIYLVVILCYLLPLAFWNVSTANYTFSAVELEGLKVSMEMDVWEYWWYLWTNAVVAAVSLGLAIPWTRIRMLRYKLSCLTVKGEFQVYHGHTTGRQAAAGDEIGDAFDIDFGF